MRGKRDTAKQQPFLSPSAVIAAAAHELKTPLTLITYIAQTLHDEAVALSAAEKLQYVHRLELVSKRALRLVQHMTLGYRLEEQVAFMFALEPVNLQQVCEQALHELTPYATEYKQQLQLIKRTRAPVVLAHRDILHDIITNLVDNGIRHNQPGAAVTVATLARSQRVRLQVHDNGSGMSSQTLAQLRTNLGSGPQPFTGHGGTSGLGLYIVQQLVGAMGGRLGLGRAGQGTTFFVDMLRSHQLRLL